MHSRRFCFTINFKKSDNGEPAVDRQNELDRLRAVLEEHARYAIIGKEVGEEGTLHLQGYASMRKMYRFKGIKGLVGDRAHIEEAKGDEEQNFNYCSKEQDFIEIGQRQKPGKRNDLVAIAEMVKEGATMQQVADVAPDTYIRNYRGIAAYAALQTQHYEHDTTRGLWLYGAPGVGKSHHARNFSDAQGDVYIKGQNKWFDGYAGEDVLLLDDLDTPVLGHYLKIWADKWACTGEIKGGTVKLQHKYIVVTSNYTPATLWPDDEQMQQAVQRRFKMVHCTGLCEHLKELADM